MNISSLASCDAVQCSTLNLFAIKFSSTKKENKPKISILFFLFTLSLTRQDSNCTTKKSMQEQLLMANITNGWATLTPLIKTVSMSWTFRHFIYQPIHAWINPSLGPVHSILGPVHTVHNFVCFVKKSVNRKPFVVRTTFFTYQIFSTDATQLQRCRLKIFFQATKSFVPWQLSLSVQIILLCKHDKYFITVPSIDVSASTKNLAYLRCGKGCKFKKKLVITKFSKFFANAS